MRFAVAAALALLAVPRHAMAQALPVWADVSPEGAAVRIPVAWIAAHADSMPWVASWGKGDELLIRWQPAPNGVFIHFPVPASSITDRARRATVRFYQSAQCGDIACILFDSATAGHASVEGDVVVVSLVPGAALNSLLSVRPDSLRLDGPAGREPLRPIGWIRVTYSMGH